MAHQIKTVDKNKTRETSSTMIRMVSTPQKKDPAEYAGSVLKISYFRMELQQGRESEESVLWD